MRGKAKSKYGYAPVFRITPAHAGKRKESYYILAGIWDHPRTCGEKSYWRNNYNR